jgi:hypothetical protein
MAHTQAGSETAILSQREGEIECETIGQYADIFWECLKVELPGTMQEEPVKVLMVDPFTHIRPWLAGETETVYRTR